jgi:flagella basal body P-ring formation protein FlgA
MSRFVLHAVAAAMLAHAAADAAPVTATLRQQVSVDRAQVELGDVAQLDAAASEREALEHVVVGRAPRVGYVQRFTPAMLAAAVRKAGVHADIAWQGSPTVQVAVTGQQIPGADITHAAMAALSAADPHGDYVFNSVRAVEAVEVPARAFSLRVRPLDRAAFAPRISVWVDVVVDGDVYRAVQVPVEVVQERAVLVAHADLRAGGAVEPGQFDTVRRNVAGAGSRVLDRLPAGARVRLARPMRAGDVLTADKLMANDAVASGDHVHVVARAGAAVIETDGVVMRGGASGDVVEVVTAHSAQPVSGTLLDDHTVAVQ